MNNIFSVDLESHPERNSHSFPQLPAQDDQIVLGFPFAYFQVGNNRIHGILVSVSDDQISSQSSILFQ
jgi:hypothetical protein